MSNFTVAAFRHGARLLGFILPTFSAFSAVQMNYSSEWRPLGAWARELNQLPPSTAVRLR
jgi:hypothetical protein